MVSMNINSQSNRDPGGFTNYGVVSITTIGNLVYTIEQYNKVTTYTWPTLHYILSGAYYLKIYNFRNGSWIVEKSVTIYSFSVDWSTVFAALPINCCLTYNSKYLIIYYTTTETNVGRDPPDPTHYIQIRSTDGTLIYQKSNSYRTLSTTFNGNYYANIIVNGSDYQPAILSKDLSYVLIKDSDYLMSYLSFSGKDYWCIYTEDSTSYMGKYDFDTDSISGKIELPAGINAISVKKEGTKDNVLSYGSYLAKFNLG